MPGEVGWRDRGAAVVLSHADVACVTGAVVTQMAVVYASVQVRTALADAIFAYPPCPHPVADPARLASCCSAIKYPDELERTERHRCAPAGRAAGSRSSGACPCQALTGVGGQLAGHASCAEPTFERQAERRVRVAARILRRTIRRQRGCDSRLGGGARGQMSGQTTPLPVAASYWLDGRGKPCRVSRAEQHRRRGDERPGRGGTASPRPTGALLAARDASDRRCRRRRDRDPRDESRCRSRATLRRDSGPVRRFRRM
jgi:hypothetical protein